MIKALPLKTSASVLNFERSLLLKVLIVDDFIATGECGAEYCLLLTSGLDDIGAIAELEWGAIIYSSGCIVGQSFRVPIIFDVKLPEVIASGDVISVSANRIDVVYRRSSHSNMLFVTEQCNHQCIMCSQPPRDIDDNWRIAECHAIIDLIDKDEVVLGISGGEPTLLRDNLIDLVDHCKVSLPNTCLHILSNGVAFSERTFTEKLSVAHSNLFWGIPIYGCTPQWHDFHTQVTGSFNRTIHGLYNLASFDQSIELRVVLTKMVLANIKDILEFILWNLPFVSSVALMGVEPIGYARSNHELVWEEFDKYSYELCHHINYLRNSSIQVFLYNIPLCKLPVELHEVAVQSISDWKNVYEPECFDCQKLNQCCGFFKSHDARFVRKGIIPFKTIG